MASETTQAAILILRAKALEVYGVLKDLYAKQAEMGDSEKIASHALNLAQLEGAMLTLQQYFAPERPEQKAGPPGPMPPGLTPQMTKPKRAPIRADELMKTSTTFRNSQKNHKKKEKTAETS